MPTATAERRRRTRTTAKAIPLQVTSPQWSGPPVLGTLLDIDDGGCGLQLGRELPAGLAVTISGELFQRGTMVTVQGTVGWSQSMNGRYWRVGIKFAAKSAPPPQPESEDVDADDLYESLQISSNADSDTIHRVYRFLAQRFHPDNSETGDAAQFRRISAAYQVLSTPERRAAYDATYKQSRAKRWRIFHQTNAAQSVEAEQAVRQGILGLLYTKRRSTPSNPGMTIVELEDLLGVPRDHMEFPLWYLRETGMLTRTDNGRFAVTAAGVTQAEQHGASWLKPLGKERQIEARR